MDPYIWAFIFFAFGIVLLLAELFLPSHGLLGILGTLALVGCIVMCFRINQYLGLTVFLVMAIAAPFAVTLSMKIWPNTPVGKRMVLQPVESRLQPPLVKIGETGMAVSELKPMGTCEFGGERLEARSQMGIIAAGEKVKVVNIESGRVIVRSVTET